jgi:hypothetical protein
LPTVYALRGKGKGKRKKERKEKEEFVILDNTRKFVKKIPTHDIQHHSYRPVTSRTMVLFYIYRVGICKPMHSLCTVRAHTIVASQLITRWYSCHK